MCFGSGPRSFGSDNVANVPFLHFHRASLFLGGDIDVSVWAEAAVGARLGKELFGRCLTKYRNVLPLQVESSGKLWLGAQVSASDVRY